MVTLRLANEAVSRVRKSLKNRVCAGIAQWWRPATSLLDPNEEGPYAARAGIAIVVEALGLLAILLDLFGCVPG